MSEQVMELTWFGRDPKLANEPHLEVRVSFSNADTITFRSDDPFKITGIRDEGTGQPAQPLIRDTPYDGIKGSDNKYRANSGSPKSGTQGKTYKVIFVANGQTIDPHFIVDP